MTKKIILFIVDGTTDKTSFDNILNRLVSNEKVKYVVYKGDITQKAKPKNVKSKIRQAVLDFLKEPKNKHYNIDDISKIVHLVDIDAVFIDTARILPTNKNISYYTEKNHFAINVEQIRKRNDNKRQVIKKIARINNISFNETCILYESYYFSCNLEHVLHNKPNCTQKEKEDLSYEFAKRFCGYEDKFIEFINDDSISVDLPYIESWQLIMKPENALKRKTNFNLFFK